MRTRIALAATSVAAFTSIIFSNVVAAEGAGAAGSRSLVPPGHRGTAHASPASSAIGDAAHGIITSAGLRISSADEISLGDPQRSTVGDVRSLSAELSMSGALSYVFHHSGSTASTAKRAGRGAPSKAVVTSAPAPVLAAPPPSAAPVALPPPPLTDSTSTATSDWQCIRVHESGDRYNSPSAPAGAYGIVASTWSSFGMSGWPYEASAATQDALALELYNRYGWSPWSTRYACGLG